MQDEIVSKANFVKVQIENDFKNLNVLDLEYFFDKFTKDRRTISFLEYYNRTVLDKEKINFGTFSYQWALHLPVAFYTKFDKKYDLIVDEIKNKKNIKDFYLRFCIDELGKKRGSFCSKLFHTVLSFEFPPVDNPIKNKFHLRKEDFIYSVLIIKEGYGLFIKENRDKIISIRKLLSKPKFAYLRINELSDIRILDMYYWFKENREK